MYVYRKLGRNIDVFGYWISGVNNCVEQTVDEEELHTDMCKELVDDQNYGRLCMCTGILNMLCSLLLLHRV
jgi:hypothetical protein